MWEYIFRATTSCGMPVMVEMGFDSGRSRLRLSIIATDPNRIDDGDACLFSTERLPADLRRPPVQHLESILEGFGIRTPAQLSDILRPHESAHAVPPVWQRPQGSAHRVSLGA